jgi:hypothetical protein
MAWWNAEEYQIQMLAGMLMASWDKETKKNTLMHWLLIVEKP